MIKLLTICFVLFAGFQPCFALSVKDLVKLQGDQENEISGIGLVTGLSGTGDKKNPEKDAMVKAWLSNADIDISGEALDAKNVALVTVSGKLPPNVNPGQKISLSVSAYGNAKSLRGGVLLYTQLSYPGDVESEKAIYATAAGPLLFSPGSSDTVAQIKGMIQRGVPSTVVKGGLIKLQMNKPDYVDADRITRQINQYFNKYDGSDIAKAVTAGIINVRVPKKFIGNHVSFIAELKKVPVLFTDVSAKIRINSKTGMVTFNERVEVSPFAFYYKDMHIKVLPPDAEPDNLAKNQLHMVDKKDPNRTDLQNFINALNQIRGISAQDLAEIVKEVHKIGALHGELEIE